ncbi:hypothetical protein METBIDRAFT_79629 [Metschnikowia bicuspidata var. bicuspidata NRRL YB-4993]|uniref:Transcription initiation factor TFIID subunit 2 n=1 Tax=Metschnikowia bicuspidata var. bicuspidata NRRL YB-4993 TaxID=869754 RepID=A0A1A0H6T9_9ASCO|nr:hypothetical protein METBIDRAFT_79629 [Metschnikowia bicuspidata var. bicuspidata NRRL YB-4993]OBA19627.1 hypothetical protein METBIDRAFT_79629 [Metschnikowia bicuspidata var. bicuspidata NRRL YB-4993]
MGPYAGTGETPKPRTGRSKNGSLLAQKFQIAHQQVNLDIDFCNKRAVGHTELSIVPTSTSLRTIRLDARTMSIKKVFINGNEQTDYIHRDLLYINNPETFEECATLRIPNIWDVYSSGLTIHQHHLLRQKLSYVFGHLEDDYNLMSEKGENLNTEELTILLPEKLKMELANTVQRTPTSAAPTTSLTPSNLRFKNGSNDVFNSIQIRIEYEIINPKDGLNFVCNPTTEKRMWHVYTSNSEHNISASSWVPCIDSLLERSSWSIELSIPRSVRDIVETQVDEPHSTRTATDKPASVYDKTTEEDRCMAVSHSADASGVEIEIDEDDDDRENYDLYVCSGDVNNTKEAPHPTDISKKLVSWSVFNPVCAHHIGWAVGAYQSFELSDFTDGSAQLVDMDDEYEAMEKDETSSSVSLFYLPGQEELVKNTCIFAQKALDFFLKEYGSFPFSSYGIAFVQDPRYQKNNFAGLSLLSADLLYPATIIEPMFTTTEDILECIAAQWSGISIVPLTFNDLWCTIGIAKFMTFQFTKSLVGTNEFRYQIQKKMSAIVEEDVGQRPLGLQALQAPISEFSFEFIRLKAPIILFILDRRMTKTDKSFGFTRVLPKLFLQAMSGDLQNGALSTLHFQYVCEKVNRNRLESFFKQWVFGVGTPIFNITQKFNKKRSLIEVVIRQSQLQQAKAPHPKSDTFARDAAAMLNQEQTFPVQQTFLGPMTIRVHEADGTPYEHIVDIKDKVVKFDVQYNTKFKRLKKNKEDSADGALVFSKLGDILQDEKDLSKWRFEEWPKRDEEFLDPFEWLRVDTDFEWIATFNLKQPDYMFGSQLQQDRDIEAQIAACEYFGFQEKPLMVHCTMLTRTLMDRRYFYGVRIAAAKALANLSRSGNNFFGLEYLIQAFKSLYCFENSMIPKSNNFQDFGEFFVQKEIPGIMADIKDENGASPPKVKALLYNLLKYNDNSNNDFEDCYYLSSLVKALVRSVIPINEDGSFMETQADEISALENESREQKFISKVIEEIERLQKLDLWVPSYQSTVSRTCFEQKVLLARNNLCNVTFEGLLHLTHQKHASWQRLMAFEGLLLLGGLKNAEVLKYFLKVCLLEDLSTHFQSRMISGLMKAVCEAAIQGLPSTLDDPEFRSSEQDLGSNGKLTTQSNMVVVEESQTSEMNLRRDAFARATVKGAIEILRRDLGIGIGLQTILWEFLHTSLLSINDKKAIFLLCDILYEAVASFPVTIPVPCVPFEELKKRIVAKISGEGKVTIKREARFKIQLSTKIHIFENKLKSSCLSEKKEQPVIQPEVSPPAPPKLKLKISSSTASNTQEEKKSCANVIPTQLVTRDLLNKMQLKIKLQKEKLKEMKSEISREGLKSHIYHEALKQRIKVIESVKCDGSVVKITFGDKKMQQNLAIRKATKTPARYVRIFTKRRKIELSAEPFPEKEPQLAEKEPTIKQDKEPDMKEKRAISQGDSISEENPRVMITENLETRKVDSEVAKEERQSTGGDNTGRLTSILEKPNPFKKSSLEEPGPDRSRAASPFSKETSPTKLTKRKKTKIYIHGKSNNSPSPTGLVNEIKAPNSSSNKKSPSSESPDTKEEIEGRVASAERGVSDIPAEEPKRKLKLKLSLK